MRAVIQRVLHARVRVGQRVVSEIGPGLLIYLAIGRNDTCRAAETLAAKIASLRIFNDEHGKMNRSLIESDGAALVVSEFTLYGDCRKGRRPNYMLAAPHAQAREIYEFFARALASCGLNVSTGEFHSMMEVESVNDGPVTLLLDSDRLF